MPHIILAFSSAATVERNVAGVPAGARALHALTAFKAGDALDRCTLSAGPDWSPSGHLLVECGRLAPDVELSFSPPPRPADTMLIQGETFVAALARLHGRLEHDTVLLALAEAQVRVPTRGSSETAYLRLLHRAGRQILKATGKASDGIVSRHVNRPISRAISQQLLRVPGIEPIHASAGTALLGLAMILALLFGGDLGLIAGALLFQAASVFDGVDGEMARATYRSSREGASLDSIIDACTNLAFVMGAAINVGLSGDVLGAVAGGASLLILATGLTLLGKRARNRGDAVNFDIIKLQLRKGGVRSLFTECLIHLTMRDFYAAACAVLIVIGLTHFVLLAFAIVAMGWFCVITASLFRSSTRRLDVGAFNSRRSQLSNMPQQRDFEDGGIMLFSAPRSRNRW